MSAPYRVLGVTNEISGEVLDTAANLEEDGDDYEQTRLLSPQPASSNRPDRFAKVEYLSRYIPELDPKNARAKTMRVKMAKRTTMLKTQMTIATVVVIFNLSITIWAVLSYPPDGRGVGTFSFSDCSSTTALNSALHVALNIISSLFLGAGNYCMQILVAPSRDEIAQTHLKGSALEIGVPSMSNLRYIKRSRVAAWFGIGFIVALLHFFWNSAIFTSLPIVVIPRAVATNDFLTVGYNWTASDPLSHFSWWKPAPGYGEASKNTSMIYSLQDGAANFTYLDTEACIKRYINPMTATSSVIIVARNVSTVQNNGSSLIDGWVSGWEPWSGSSAWICRAYQDIHQDRFCNWDFAKSFTNDWRLSWPRGVQVDHCLSADEGSSQDRCGLHYSTHILAIVCVCTFLESLLVYWTAFHHFRNTKTKEQKRDHHTMVTIGDAINSFLEHPQSYINELTDEDDDASTSYRLGAVQIQKTTWLVKPRVSWFKAVNIKIWVISLVLFSTGLAITSYSIGSSIEWISQKGVDVSPAALWQYGFQVNPAMLARDMGPLNSIAADGPVMLLGNILIANSPQVMISFLYLFYNNILTRQLVSDEWVRFLQEEGKKPLRVSSPEGMQRSSYFLSLPFKYSVPLMVLAILLHWLISQSIFLVQSSAFAPGKDGARLPMYDYTARGYSPLGSIMAIALGFALVIALLLNSVFRSYRNIPANFHLMAFNSSAIEALCQRPDADSDARLFPVRIGVAVMDPKPRTSPSALSEPSYTAVVFSTDTTLQVPEHGEQYVQPILICGEGIGYKFVSSVRRLMVNGYTLICNAWDCLVSAIVRNSRRQARAM